MVYKRHNLSIQTYRLTENSSVLLPEQCTWKVLKHQGDGIFDARPETDGELCLVLEEAENNMFPIISILLTDEALEISEKLRAFAEGSINNGIDPNDTSNFYDRKHNLVIWKYQINKPGHLTLPEICQWKVMKHQGEGRMDGSHASMGAICLILQDFENRFWPVMSFFTPAEALQLSEQLQNATQKSPNRAFHTKATILTTQQAAEILGVTPRHITRLIKKKLLDVSCFGKVYVLTKSEVERYQRERNPPGRPPHTLLSDHNSIDFEDRNGKHYRISFSTIRRFCPEEKESLEDAVQKLIDAVVKRDNLDTLDYACKNYLAKKDELITSLKDSFDSISIILASDPNFR